MSQGSSNSRGSNDALSVLCLVDMVPDLDATTPILGRPYRRQPRRRQTGSNRRRSEMTQVYFHCSSATEVFVDGKGAVVDDLIEAHDHAASVVRSLTSAHNLEDWRD